VDLGNPCTSKDHDLFEAATMVKIGKGEKALLGGPAWLLVMRLTDIAPKIYKIAKMKNAR
jgi:hypothetical protein